MSIATTARLAVAAAVVAIPASTASAGLIIPGGPTTITVFNEETNFPFFGITSALLNQVPHLGGMEIVETRASWTIDATSDYDFSGAIITLSASLFTEDGPQRVFADFTAEDTGTVGTGRVSGSITTDALNGEIWNNGQVSPGGKKGKRGEGGGELIPASLFEWSMTGDLPDGTPLPWGALRTLTFEIDVVPVPAPGAAALFAAAGLAASRRRR